MDRPSVDENERPATLPRSQEAMQEGVAQGRQATVTDEESLKADRELAADILWMFLRAPGGRVALEVLYDHFEDVDVHRIDDVLDDLAEIIEDDDGREGWLILSANAKSEFARAERAVCCRLAEEVVT